MATLDELELALRNADAAGRKEDAARLAQAYQEEKRRQVGSGATLKFGPFDTGIELPQKATEFLAGAGRRLTQIGSLGMAEGDKGADQLLNQSGWATGGSAVADLSTLIGGGTLLRGAAAIPQLAQSVPRLASALNTVGSAAQLPRTWSQAMAVPAVYNAATTPGGPSDRISSGAGAGAAGAAGYGLFRGAGQFFRPTASNPGASDLASAGVRLTPGQAIGGIADTVEQKLTSFPIVGDLIANARTKSIQSFNTATANKVLEPLGIKVPSNIQPGRELLNFVNDKIDEAYAAVKPNITAAVDQQLRQDMQSAMNVAAGAGKGAEFVAKIKAIVDPRAQNNQLSGQAYKDVVSDLGAEVRKWTSYGNPTADRELGYALDAARKAIASAAQRSSPADAVASLKAADAAHSMWLRMEGAGASIGAKEGVFSPAQLLGQTKKFSTGVRDKQFALGDAQLQDFAAKGVDVLGSKVPDSGTAGRMLLNLGTLSALGAGAGADQVWNGGKVRADTMSVLSNPAIGGTIAAGAAAYTPAGQAVFRALAARPEMADPALQKLRDLIYMGAPIGGLLGPPNFAALINAN